MVKYVIFDLDGTLIDTVDDLGRACDFLLVKAGRAPIEDREVYKSYVGNGARLLVSRAFGGSLTDGELDAQYRIFKEKYNEIKLENAYAYSGIKKVVQKLKAAHFGLAVCTNKPAAAAREMIEAVFGTETFDFVCGAQDSGPVKPDVSRLCAMLSEKGIRPDDCIWVGDSGVDIASARNLGCPVIAVTWGFVEREKLLSLSPDDVADRAEDLLKMISASA